MDHLDRAAAPLREADASDVAEEIKRGPAAVATPGSVSSGSPMWPTVVLSPRAKRTTPATIDPSLVPKAIDVITAPGVQQSTELDYTLGLVVLTGVVIP